jgi:hypothetical protein
MPTKSPHLLSCSARLKSARFMECVRMMLNFPDSSAYSSWFHRMSSPRCRIVGLLELGFVSTFESLEDETDGGGGRPESCGVDVATDILSVCAGCLVREWS